MVAAAQYADEMLSSAVDGALKAPDMLTLAGEGDTTASTPTTYLDYFVETGTDKKGGITNITIQKGTATLNPNDKIELTDGDKLSLVYNYSIPGGVLTDNNKTLTYQLPKGITPSEEKTFPVVDTSNGNKPVGQGKVDSTGKVTLTFNDDFETDKPFAGHFGFDVIASTADGEESSSIKIPGGFELIVTRARDLSIKKQGATPVVENGNTYIVYTITVSSEDGWPDLIEILDVITKKDEISGQYVENSFELYKIRTDSSSKKIDKFTNKIDNDNCTFKITGLEKLGAGESYKLTYRVKVTQNTTKTVTLDNKARSNIENKWSHWTTTFENRISKDGSYDPDKNQITWTVTVKNPYGENLKGSKVVDTVTTDGAKIVGNITLTETCTKEGNRIDTVITNAIAPNKSKTGFEYTFGEVYGKEYKFTYVTSVPKTADGKPVEKVHNKSDFTINNKTYTFEKDVHSSDRDWYFNKYKF